MDNEGPFLAPIMRGMLVLVVRKGERDFAFLFFSFVFVLVSYYMLWCGTWVFYCLVLYHIVWIPGARVKSE